MKTKKSWTTNMASLLIIFLLITFLVVGGCTKEPAPPSEEPAPPSHEIVNIEILSSSSGTVLNACAVALSELLAKHHPWLRATARTTGGPPENIETLRREPDRRKSTIVALTLADPWGAKHGIEPYFTAPLEDIKYVFTLTKAVTGWATLDPNITKLEHLAGKKVCFFPGASSANLILSSVFLGMGKEFSDTVKIEYLSVTAGPKGVLDGLLDATAVSTTVMPPGEPWTVLSWGMELMNNPKAHYIDIPEEAVRLGAERGGFPNTYIEVPAGVIKEGSSAFGGIANNMFYSAHADFPDEIAYEIAKFVVEYQEEFADYVAVALNWTPAYHAAFPLGVEEMHPGAVNYYRELGVKVGN